MRWRASANTSRKADDAFARFREARALTLAVLATLDEQRLARRAVFEGYGPTTRRGLVHFLCSHDQQYLAGLQWLSRQIASLPPKQGQGRHVLRAHHRAASVSL